MRFSLFDLVSESTSISNSDWNLFEDVKLYTTMLSFWSNFFFLNFLCSLELSGSKVGQTVIKISSTMVQEHKNCHSRWHRRGDSTSIQIQQSTPGRSFILSSLLLSSLYHLYLCVKNQMSETKTNWVRKGFGKISSTSSIIIIPATRWRPRPLHHPIFGWKFLFSIPSALRWKWIQSQKPL